MKKFEGPSNPNPFAYGSAVAERSTEFSSASDIVCRI
jgi:hypothetical protein